MSTSNPNRNPGQVRVQTSANIHQIDSPDPPKLGQPQPHPVNPSGCTITAQGHAMPFSENLSRVFALVIRSGSFPDPLPNSVEGTVHPNKADYSFDAVPGAINGEPNRLCVWAQFSGFAQWEGEFRDFVGTGGGSGCDLNESRSKPLFRAAPRVVRVRPGDTTATAPLPENPDAFSTADPHSEDNLFSVSDVVLNYDVRQGTPARPVWMSPQGTHGKDFWTLQVTLVDGVLQGVLTLLRILDSGDEQTCRWVATRWNFTRPNQLQAVWNGINAHPLPVLFVEPA